MPDESEKFHTVNEKGRTYVYPGGERITFDDVEQISVRKSGNHRLNLKDGRKVIVMKGWLAIEIYGLAEWIF